MPIDATIPLKARNPKFMTPAEGVALKDLLTQSRMNESTLADQPNVQRRAQEAHESTMESRRAEMIAAELERLTKGRESRKAKGNESAAIAYNLYTMTPGDPETRTAAMRAWMKSDLDEYVSSGQAARDGASQSDIQKSYVFIATATPQQVGSISLTAEQAAESAAYSHQPSGAQGVPGTSLDQIANVGAQPPVDSPELAPLRFETTVDGRPLDPSTPDPQQARPQGGVPMSQIAQGPTAAPAAQGNEVDSLRKEADALEAQARQHRGSKTAMEIAKDLRAQAKEKRDEADRRVDNQLNREKHEETLRRNRAIEAKEALDRQSGATDTEIKMQKDFVKASKVFVETRDSYSRVKVSASDPSAAGDLALIFNYMKMLDPGSTVREGEFATAQNAAGVGGRVQSFYNNILRGERMNPTQRNDFVSRSGKIYKAIEANHAKLESQFRRDAKDRGLDPDKVVIDFRAADQSIPDIPAAGEIQQGYRFLGGDPGLEKNWEKVKK